MPFGELRVLLGAAAAGVHTMRDEHFGIGVVEYMVRSDGAGSGWRQGSLFCEGGGIVCSFLHVERERGVTAVG